MPKKLNSTLLFLICLFITTIVFGRKESIDSILSVNQTYEKTVGALRNFDEQDLLASIEKINTDEAKCKVYNALCWQYFVSKPQKAMYYAKKQLPLAEKLNDNSVLLFSYDNMAYLHLGFGDNEKAIKYMLNSLKIKELMDDRKGIATSLSGLASVYYRMNNYQLALDYYMQTLKIEEEIGDGSSKSNYRIASTLGNIAQCHIEMLNIDKGLEFYQRSIAIHEANNQSNELGIAYANIGDVYYKYKKDYDLALDYLFKAMELEESKNDIRSAATVYNTISEVYSAKHDYQKAIMYAEKSLKKANQAQDKRIQKDAHKSISLALYKQGKFKEAYDHFAEAFALKDSIFSTESSEQIAEMQTKYDTEKKEAENKLLKTEQALDREELKRKSAQQKMLLIGLLVVLVVASYVAYSLIQKKKTNRLLNQQNEEISAQKEIIEEKNKDITDSINYAQRIQNAILPEDGLLKKYFESFIYYRPKDIVSGDFYWVKEQGDRIFFSVVDCTGHGVPGAFMSIIGYNSLNRIVEEAENLETGGILDRLNDTVIQSIAKSSESGISIKDGMDLSICCYDVKSKELQYSGAHNSLYLIRKNSIKAPENLEVNIKSDEQSLYEFKADKMAIGGDINESKYKTHIIKLEPGDSVYLFSDGYADQFGGPKGKKFMYKRFKELLLNMQTESMSEQLTTLDKTMKDWMGDLDQLDDICVMGIRG